MGYPDGMKPGYVPPSMKEAVEREYENLMRSGGDETEILNTSIMINIANSIGALTDDEAGEMYKGILKKIRVK